MGPIWWGTVTLNKCTTVNCHGSFAGKAQSLLGEGGGGGGGGCCFVGGHRRASLRLWAFTCLCTLYLPVLLARRGSLSREACVYHAKGEGSGQGKGRAVHSSLFHSPLPGWATCPKRLCPALCGGFSNGRHFSEGAGHRDKTAVTRGP